MEMKASVPPEKPYTGLTNPPALSPPTPSVQSHAAAPYAPGPSMARSTSHNTTLVTPDENPATAHSRLGGQPSASSQPVHPHPGTEKQGYQNGQYSNYDARPQVVQPSYSGSSTGVPAGAATSGGPSWQQNYAIPSSAPSSGSELQDGQSNYPGTEGVERTTEAMVAQNNSYVTVSATSSVVVTTALKPTKDSKDYFDGVVFLDKSARPNAAVDSTSDEVAIDPAIEAQPSSAYRPVFTMPFGNPDGPTEPSENPMMDLSHIKGPWQRW